MPVADTSVEVAVRVPTYAWEKTPLSFRSRTIPYLFLSLFGELKRRAAERAMRTRQTRSRGESGWDGLVERDRLNRRRRRACCVPFARVFVLVCSRTLSGGTFLARTHNTGSFGSAAVFFKAG
ncbi:hypothetical protein MRX96_042639 [Rhipicephalus microplus]